MDTNLNRECTRMDANKNQKASTPKTLGSRLPAPKAFGGWKRIDLAPCKVAPLPLLGTLTFRFLFASIRE